MAFAPVVLETSRPHPGAAPVEQAHSDGSPVIEIVIGAATVRIPAGTELANLQVVLRPVRAAWHDGRREAQPGSYMERETLTGDAKGQGSSGSNREAESTDGPSRGSCSLVQRFHETDHIRSVVIPGRGRRLAASRRPGMTPDMIQTSETLH
jgi:hypothetical protein